MKKIKKLTALLLTLVMSLALAVPCFAAEPQTGPEKNGIYLKEGDTVVVNGVIVSLKKADEVEAHNTARAGVHYVANTRTWTNFDMYSDDGYCDSKYGNTLVFDLNNRSDGEMELMVWLDGVGELPFYCIVGRDDYVLSLEDPFISSDRVHAEWNIYPAAAVSYIDFTIRVYQTR